MLDPTYIKTYRRFFLLKKKKKKIRGICYSLLLLESLTCRQESEYVINQCKAQTANYFQVSTMINNHYYT